MKTGTKKNLANLSIYVMMITISIIIIWFIGFIISTTFNLNVFTERTSTFVYALIAAAFVIVGCSAFLNISLNISVIADGRPVAESEQSRFNFRRLWGITAGIIVIIIGILFVGDYFSREQGKKSLMVEANGVVNRYTATVNKIPFMLDDSSQINNIPGVLKILSNQKENFNSVSIITADKMDGQIILLEISEYSTYKQLQKQYYDNSFFKGSEKDCMYLEKVFTGKTTDSLVWTEKEDFHLYIPVINSKQNFVLCFSKITRYGSIGS
jgi:hypothetical protein